jgi:hypothetical protein
MPRGRTTSFTIRLTPEERRTLLLWQRLTSIPAGLARRGRMILLLADGMTITEAAATVGLSRRHAYKWIQRFIHSKSTPCAFKPFIHRGLVRFSQLIFELKNIPQVEHNIVSFGLNLSSMRIKDGQMSMIEGPLHSPKKCKFD